MSRPGTVHFWATTELDLGKLSRVIHDWLVTEESSMTGSLHVGKRALNQKVYQLRLQH